MTNERGAFIGHWSFLISRLRTLDAIHLATYYRVKELDPMIEMLTFDERIRGEV